MSDLHQTTAAEVYACDESVPAVSAAIAQQVEGLPSSSPRRAFTIANLLLGAMHCVFPWRRSGPTGFVADGYRRARLAAEPVIRRAVRAEFEAELNAAPVEGRSAIRRRMDLEIKRRLELVAPADGLY